MAEDRHPTEWTVHHGMATFTETEFRWHLLFDEIPWPLRSDLIEWLRFHGIDASEVQVSSTITRDLERRAVVVEEYLILDEDGRVQYDPETGRARVESRLFQGETEPLPWPFTIEVLTEEQCLSHQCGRTEQEESHG